MFTLIVQKPSNRLPSEDKNMAFIHKIKTNSMPYCIFFENANFYSVKYMQ
jgi:hypothetical protein